MRGQTTTRARGGLEKPSSHDLSASVTYPESGTDWARVEAMTDEQAFQNALDDPDSQPLTPELRARLRRVPNPRQIRTRLGLTQEQFARRFEIALGTLRDWEQGVRIPDSTAKAYLRVIDADPEAAERALASRVRPHQP